MSESMKCCCFLFHHISITTSVSPHSVCIHALCTQYVTQSSFKDVNTWLCGASISVSHPFKIVSSNKERNSGPTSLSLVFFFYTTWFYWLYITSVGRVLATLKMCFKLNPELSLSLFSLLFMKPKWKKRSLIFSGYLISETSSLYSKRRQGLFLNLFILLESRECTHGECQVLILFRGEGEKKYFLPVVCVFAFFLPKGERKARGVVLLGPLPTT